MYILSRVWFRQGGRKQRKPGLNMSQQDSGNMLLLLNAVEGVKSMDRSSGEARRQGKPSQTLRKPFVLSDTLF